MDNFDEKVIGYESTKNILRQILDALKRPELYKSKGASIPRGLLMESDPGLGKSLLATVFIKESGRKSYVFRKTSQENSFLDELRAAFSAAKEAAPSILLLEDLNLYVESNSPYAPEWACLQACIDDARNTDIFVIATTNDTKYMPPSLLRPGRFDYTLYLDPPTGKTAEKIVSYYLRDKDLAEDTIKQKLENAKTHAEFDKLLQEISAVDAEIDHDNLTSEQKTHYDQLNKSCTDTISAKMRQLEYKDNIDYNKKAVNAYNSAFTSFKNNESRYKDKSQLFGLVSTTLFAYDAGRLFNETLIFYNHVYSYIFSKLDDNGKLELTRYSIECERKLR